MVSIDSLVTGTIGAREAGGAASHAAVAALATSSIPSHQDPAQRGRRRVVVLRRGVVGFFVVAVGVCARVWVVPGGVVVVTGESVVAGAVAVIGVVVVGGTTWPLPDRAPAHAVATKATARTGPHHHIRTFGTLAAPRAQIRRTAKPERARPDEGTGPLFSPAPR
jgi:hypothetical protein